VFKSLEAHQTPNSIRATGPKNEAFDKRSPKARKVLTGDGEALRFGSLRQAQA
jgi:hypothetical protein